MPPKFFDHRDIKWPGTWLVQNQIPSAIPQIPFNRTLFIQQFTDEAPSEVEFIEDCQTVQDVFDKFQPSKTVDLTVENGVSDEVELRFNSLMDFGRNGIIQQSELLNKISAKQQLYESFMEKLTDEQLKIMLSSPEDKSAYIGVLKNLIEELEAADPDSVDE